MSAKKYDFSVVKHIGTIKEGTYSKELNLVSRNGNKPVYDIRNYKVDENGIKTELKGISLSLEEICILKDFLNNTELEEL